MIPLHDPLIPAVSKSSPKTTPQKPRFYGVFCCPENRTRNLRFLVQKCLVPFRLPPTIFLMKDKRVAIYVRVSTQDQNLDQQEEELNRYCELRNWSNVIIYRDKVSGTKSSREGLDDLMKAVRKHRHDVVLCYKIDRLGRSLSHLALLIEELKVHGTALVVPSQGISTEEDNPAGALTLNILCAISEFERSLISERTRVALASKKAAGVKLGRPSKVSGIAEKVKGLKNTGMSLRKIAQELSVSLGSVQRALAV